MIDTPNCCLGAPQERQVQRIGEGLRPDTRRYTILYRGPENQIAKRQPTGQAKHVSKPHISLASLK